MAAPHECVNCKVTTTAQSWMCDDCQRAVNAEVSALGARPAFADVDEARLRALTRRRHTVGR